VFVTRGAVSLDPPHLKMRYRQRMGRGVWGSCLVRRKKGGARTKSFIKTGPSQSWCDWGNTERHAEEWNEKKPLESIQKKAAGGEQKQREKGGDTCIPEAPRNQTLRAGGPMKRSRKTDPRYSETRTLGRKNQE